MRRVADALTASLTCPLEAARECATPTDAALWIVRTPTRRGTLAEQGGRRPAVGDRAAPAAM